jgi:hypothetical protein
MELQTYQIQHSVSCCHVADILDNLRPVSPKPLLPGHIERVTTPLSPLTSHSGAAAPSSDGYHHRSAAEQRSCERFLKINVRHITDGQVGCHSYHGVNIVQNVHV